MAPSLRRGVLLAIAACLAAVSANPLPANEAAAIPEAEMLVKEQPDAVRASECTTTVPVFPTFTFGPVRTVYTTTTTATHLVDCGGCNHLALSYVHLGVGPVVFFTTTTTAQTPAATTVLECGNRPAEATPAPAQ
ncbi:hypothetical protein HRG_008978 [Hirsutella rhossiliensis]|uniref:Uncharacterized protein n=1 Tax=Hirsutella rhossiliensis TaxID=111463 RepID=A0A9P8MR91_9HYPO|nr:uncharacterized protein HRG_08978 [Hirsutella rhossiliensis]KAH0959957.1 hypothetical protein HRG_08978 [Hirsutella rhossiliensis]